MSVLSVFVDISGRVTERDHWSAPWVVAAVAVENQARDSVRSALADTPKWKNSTKASLERVFSALSSESVRTLVVKVDRDPDALAAFFAEGRRVQNALS